MPPIPTSQKRPFIPAQGVMQAEMVFTYLGQICENVFHVIQGDGATAPTVAQMNALAAALVGWEGPQGSHGRNQAAVLQSVIVRDLTTQSGPAVLYQTGLPIVGFNGGQAMPGNVTFAVKWNTALRGRSFRGRTYHIGLSAVNCDGDQIKATEVAGFLSVYQALQSAINGVPGCTMGVLSYAHNKVWRDAALFTPIVAPSIENNLDSQRRRLFGRGK